MNPVRDPTPIGSTAGHRYAVRHGSAAAPTVVCEGGLAAPVELWANLAAATASGGRSVLVSERAGTCRAPRPRGPRRMDRLAAELSAMLDAQLDAPAVLVGESFGGLVLLELARRRPDQVGALVLIDAVHPTALALSSRQRQGMARLETRLLGQAVRSAVGRPGTEDGFDQLPDDVGRRARAALHAAPWTPRTALRELRAWKRAATSHTVPAATTPAAAASAVRLPHDPPVAVVSSATLVSGDPSHARLQHGLLGLSERADAWSVPGTRPLLEPPAVRQIVEIVSELADGLDRRNPIDARSVSVGGRHG